jgi:hypothetical protein
VVWIFVLVAAVAAVAMVWVTRVARSRQVGDRFDKSTADDS